MGRKASGAAPPGGRNVRDLAPKSTARWGRNQNWVAAKERKGDEERNLESPPFLSWLRGFVAEANSPPRVLASRFLPPHHFVVIILSFSGLKPDD
jgi:hypothetical protein